MMCGPESMAGAATIIYLIGLAGSWGAYTRGESAENLSDTRAATGAAVSGKYRVWSAHLLTPWR